MSGFDRSLLEDKDRSELATIAESLGKKPPARAKKADIVALILELAGVEAGAGVAAAAAADAPPAAQLDLDGAPPVADAPVEEPAADTTTDEAPADAAEAEGRDEQRPERPAGGDQTERGQGGRGQGGQGGRNQDGNRNQDGGRNQGGGRNQEGKGNQDAKGNQDGNRNQGGGNQDGNRNQGGGSQDGNRNQGGQDGNRNQGNQGGGNQGGQDGNRNQGGGNQDPNRNQGNQNQGGQNDDDDGDEEGNRRRRRRGRNRDGQPEQFEGDPVDVEGLLDLRDDGYGFLRLRGYLPSTDDVYVSVKQVRQFGLRKGDLVAGKSRPASRNEKNPALLQIDAVNGGSPDAARDRPRFEELTPLFPDERIQLETAGAAGTMTTRIVDLIAPIGKGQRGLIVAPPKAGKTTIVKEVVRAVELNNPDVALIVLLVDERPEEVTDMKRWLIKGEVAASTFDRPSEEHVQVAELVIEKAKRLVEGGKDVMVVLDGITRLTRAYNLAGPLSGRIMSGGIDAAAIYPPKKFFGAARNAEEGGSLTILATALVETGSRMDEHIFEEFKGTGNMELRLSRRLAERRIFPAIDVDASSTRHEELLFERRQVAQVGTLRKVLGAVKDDAVKQGESDPEARGLDLLLDRLKTFKTNAEFLDEVGKAKASS